MGVIFLLYCLISLLGIDIYSSVDAMRYFQAWLNADAVRYGGRQVSSIYGNYFFLNHADHGVRCRRLD